jgi:hypothetical protein
MSLITGLSSGYLKRTKVQPVALVAGEGMNLKALFCVGYIGIGAILPALTLPNRELKMSPQPPPDA